MSKIIMVIASTNLPEDVLITPRKVGTEIINGETYINSYEGSHEWGEIFTLNAFPLNKLEPYLCYDRSIIENLYPDEFINDIEVVVMPIFCVKSMRAIRQALPNTKLVIGPYHQPPFHQYVIKEGIGANPEEPSWDPIIISLKDIDIDGVLIVAKYNDAKTYEKVFGAPVFSAPASVTSKYISDFINEHNLAATHIEEDKSLMGRIFFTRKQQPVMFGSIDYDEVSKIAPVTLIREALIHTSISPLISDQFITDRVEVRDVIHYTPYREYLKQSKANVHLEHVPVWGRSIIEAHVLGSATISSDTLWSNILYPDLEVLSQYSLTKTIIEKINLLEKNAKEMHQDAERNLKEYLAPAIRRQALPFMMNLLGENY